MSKRKSGRVVQKILISAGTLILVAIIFFATYYFMSGKSTSQYINSLYKQKLKVDAANQSAAALVANLDKLNTTDNAGAQAIESGLSAAASKIQDALNSLQAVAPPASYANQYSNYIKGIALNKKIYTQTNLILENTSSQELQAALDALSGYVTDTTNAYETSKLGNSYIKLPNEILTLQDKLNTYATAAYNYNAEKSRLLEQYTGYFDSMDNIVNSFAGVESDLGEYVVSLRNNQISIDDVYVSIEKKLSTLNDIDNSYTQLAVPPKVADHHKQLGSIIDNYISYCQQFKDTMIQLEEAGSNQDELANVNSQLDALAASYQDISKSFTDYQNLYNGDKETYSNADNL